MKNIIIICLLCAAGIAAKAQVNQQSIDSIVKKVVRDEIAKLAITKAVAPAYIDSVARTLGVYQATSARAGYVSAADYVKLQRIDSITTALTGLTNRIVQLENNSSNNNTDVSKLKTDLAALITKVAGLKATSTTTTVIQ